MPCVSCICGDTVAVGRGVGEAASGAGVSAGVAFGVTVMAGAWEIDGSKASLSAPQAASGTMSITDNNRAIIFFISGLPLEDFTGMCPLPVIIAPFTARFHCPEVIGWKKKHVVTK